jgi:hypothetical protein
MEFFFSRVAVAQGEEERGEKGPPKWNQVLECPSMGYPLAISRAVQLVRLDVQVKEVPLQVPA